MMFQLEKTEKGLTFEYPMEPHEYYCNDGPREGPPLRRP